MHNIERVFRSTSVMRKLDSDIGSFIYVRELGGGTVLSRIIAWATAPGIKSLFVNQLE